MLIVILRFCVVFCLFALVCMSKRHLRPALREAFRGPCPPKSLLVPPKQELCPPSEDCAPKKVTDSVPLKCSSRAKTPKILVIAQEFVGKNSFFADFAVKTFFCFHPRIRGISQILRDENLCFLVFILDKIFVPPKNCLCSPSP